MVFLSNFPLPTEGIRHQQVNTTVDIDGKDFGNGTLYISESSVAWQKESDGLGFSLLYPGISLHAISRDLTAFPHECLYLMIDGKLPVTEIRFIPSDKAALEAMYSAMSACQALHPDPEDVDSEDDGEFDDYEEEEEGAEHGGNGVYHGEDGLAHLTAVGRSRMAHMEAMLEMGQGDAQRTTNGRHRPVILTGDSSAPSSEQPMDVGQFQDAEEME
ncbi:hypothetical protein BaRGS_00019433 [Batillaria attramentaria]|uniref:Methylosome subunit pICln n=1 Tax=Batillaria attramentaria TaxID=370345 RepID=A0ABD0KRF7_9CAEN